MRVIVDDTKQDMSCSPQINPAAKTAIIRGHSEMTKHSFPLRLSPCVMFSVT